MLIVFDSIETIRSWLDGITITRLEFNPFTNNRNVVAVQIAAKVLRAIYTQQAFILKPTDGCILDVVAPTSIDTLKSLIEILDTSNQRGQHLFTRTQDAQIRAWLTAIQLAILKKCFIQKRSIFGCKYWV